MRMRPHHGGDAAIEVPPHGDLLARHLSMKIHEPDLDRRIEVIEELVGFPKGAIRDRHVSAPLQVDHGAFDAVARTDHNYASPGSVGIVLVTQWSRLSFEILI